MPATAERFFTDAEGNGPHTALRMQVNAWPSWTSPLASPLINALIQAEGSPLQPFNNQILTKN
jgi:hypothetical protein